MNRRPLAAVLLLALAACGPSEPDLLDRAQELGTDADLDGLDDATEQALALRFAPEVRLAPDAQDGSRPASVDWYLPKVHMRFDHSGCPDHQVIALGAVTQANLSTQRHNTTTWYCSHSGTVLPSNAKHAEFFLQPPDDAVHAGGPASTWRVYVHAKPSVVATGGVDVQYWFFYPYNDALAGFNHEGDWEHITVTVSAAGGFVSAWYAQHDGGVRYTAGQLQWNGEHPVVYSADGTHASYPAAGTWAGPVADDHAYDGGPKWSTWTNLINVGEKAAPLNGQTFIRYGGLWGEIGEFDFTTGPPTPSFQGAWDRY